MVNVFLLLFSFQGTKKKLLFRSILHVLKHAISDGVGGCGVGNNFFVVFLLVKTTNHCSKLWVYKTQICVSEHIPINQGLELT